MKLSEHSIIRLRSALFTLEKELVKNKEEIKEIEIDLQIATKEHHRIKTSIINIKNDLELYSDKGGE